ncbi:right-handed parallel beta-helix repeat-containing protein [Phycicoccus sp.]|uniref:right-handed parallel beta-helix repeat-containing protein n=1 Tax=Phycicoccus sp. TaxID=1902410 RepID=UPI002C19FC15|nr:right-handed parallel beta-helix repeat-containing protein [Phycicoccus sp.]HMM93440.1 right-handed parallel beta-helix repeat-containing protein [Phycicoccus sp.]
MTSLSPLTRLVPSSTGRRALAVGLCVASVLALVLALRLPGSTVSDVSQRCAARPTATNTGATEATRARDLTAVTTPGEELFGVAVPGSLDVTAAGATLRHVKVPGTVVVTGDDVTLDHVTAQAVVIAGARGVSVRDSNLSGGETAIQLTSDQGPARQVRDITLSGNFIHDPAATDRTSYSGTHVRGAQSVSITCSRYQLGAYGNAALYLEDANGGTSDVQVSDNWLDGGGFTVMTGASNVRLDRNTFGATPRWGLCQNTDPAPVRQSDNVRTDGSSVQPCVGTGTATPTPTSTPTRTATPTPAPTPSTRPTKASPRPSRTSPTTRPTTKPPSSTTPATGSIGSCPVRPSASTTGAHGTRSSSSRTTLGNGAVLKNANVSDLTITGSNVTVQNVAVSGGILVQGSKVTIDHVTAQNVSISSASSVVVQYSNLGRGGEDAIHVTSDRGSQVRGVTLRYNYLHDPRPSSDAHYDGTQVRGVNGLTISCSVYDGGPYTSQLNAAIYLEDANGGNSNVTIDRNWLFGYGFPIFIDPSTNTSVTRNRIGGDIHWDACYPNPKSTFRSSGNVWDATGKPLNLCGMG